MIHSVKKLVCARRPLVIGFVGLRLALGAVSDLKATALPAHGTPRISHHPQEECTPDAESSEDFYRDQTSESRESVTSAASAFFQAPGSVRAPLTAQ